MFFGKTLAAAALALLTCVSAAPAVEVSSQPAGSVLSNGERIVRGLGVNRPKRLFGETKTGGKCRYSDPLIDSGTCETICGRCRSDDIQPGIYHDRPLC